MKSLRNLVTAVLWVWGIAALIVLVGLTIATHSFAVTGLMAGAVLSIITWLVYSGLNGDLTS
jgi:hypothetical protein